MMTFLTSFQRPHRESLLLQYARMLFSRRFRSVRLVPRIVCLRERDFTTFVSPRAAQQRFACTENIYIDPLKLTHVLYYDNIRWFALLYG